MKAVVNVNASLVPFKQLLHDPTGVKLQVVPHWLHVGLLELLLPSTQGVGLTVDGLPDLGAIEARSALTDWVKSIGVSLQRLSNNYYQSHLARTQFPEVLGHPR